MKRFLNILKNINQRFNGLLAVSLTLFIILIAGVQGFVFWLNTDKGGAWLATKINGAIETSGYALIMGNFSLSGILGLKAGSASLTQNGTPIASSEDFSLSINPLPLGPKKLEIALKAKQIQIISIPTNDKNKAPTEEKTPLTELPDIYFSHADITIDIAQLLVSDTIVNGGFETKIAFEQSIGLSADTFASNGSIALSETKFSQAAYLPHTITNTFKYTLNDQKITFKDISAENQNYTVGINGFYTLADAAFNTNIQGNWGSEQQLPAGLQTPITLDASLKGNINDFSGKILAKTTYKEIQTTLQSTIERKENIISIKDINGQGGALNLNGALDYNLSSSLANGEIKAALPDLNFLNAFADNLNLSGSLTANAKVSPQNGKQTAALNAAIKNLRYDAVTVQSIDASLNASDAKNLKSARAEIVLNKGHAGNIDIKQITLNASSADQGYNLSMRGGGYSINPFKLQADAILKAPAPLDITLSSAQLKMGQGVITAKGTVKNEAIDVQITGNALNVQQMAFADLSAFPVLFDKLNVTIKGPMTAPAIIASYGFAPIAQKQYAAKFEGKTAYNTGKLTNTLIGTGKGINDFAVNLSIPLNLSLSPFAVDINKDTRLSGSANIQSDLRSLSGLFLSDSYELLGQLSADTTISGTLENPLLNGNANLKNAALTDTYNDIALLDIEGAMAFKNRQINLTRLNAKDSDRKGTLSINGEINLQNMSEPDIKASIKLQDMHILKNENYDARLNADISMDTKLNGYLISGTLSPQEVSIRIPDQFDAAIPQLNIIEAEDEKKPTNSLFTKTKLDIEFKANNQIFVSGRGLDAELAGNLAVKGNLKSPLVDGNLNIIRGRYEDFGRRFTLDNATLRFQGAVPPSPYLDITASTEVEDITAKILISSSVLDPQIKLESTPSLPEDEVLSLILFGQNIEKISPFQAIQLANTLRKLSGKGGGGFDPLQQIKSATGLDDISVETDGTDGATVGAGKYISDKVYLEVEQGTAEASGAVSVEIELTPNISLESKAAQNGESDVGVSWEWDY